MLNTVYMFTVCIYNVLWFWRRSRKKINPVLQKEVILLIIHDFLHDIKGAGL
jgi:hypothetical protein